VDRQALAAHLLVNREIGARLIDRVLRGGPLPEPVAKDVGHDREQPGFFVGARLEPIPVSVGSQIRFLH
jgi:hypothetical protein